MSRRKAITPKEAAAFGWRRVDGGKGKSGAVWRSAGGWELVHCGHPTAHHPWMLFNPLGAMICRGAKGEFRNPAFGTAWDTLHEAMSFVAELGDAFARVDPKDGRELPPGIER